MFLEISEIDRKTQQEKTNVLQNVEDKWLFDDEVIEVELLISLSLSSNNESISYSSKSICYLDPIISSKDASGVQDIYL